MYNMIWQNVQWLGMADDVYPSGHQFRSCPQSGSQMTHQQKPQLFLAAALFELDATDALAVLWRAKNRYQKVIIFTERLS